MSQYAPYPIDWATQAISKDLLDADEYLNDTVASVEVIRRLAEGACHTPCTELVAGAAERVKDAVADLRSAVEQLGRETAVSTATQEPS